MQARPGQERIVAYVITLAQQRRAQVASPSGPALGPFVDVRTLAQTGTYTIALDPQAAYIGQAKLTLYSVPPDPSPSVTIGGPGAVVSTPVPGQNATVTFTAAAGQALTVRLTASTYSLAKVTLLNPGGSTLVSARYYGTGGTTFTATAPTAGTYTVAIDPQQAYTGGTTVTVTSP